MGNESAESAIKQHMDDTHHHDSDEIRHAAIEANRPALGARIEAEVAAHARDKPHLSSIEVLRQIDQSVGHHLVKDHDRHELQLSIAKEVKSHFDQHAHISAPQVSQMIDARIDGDVIRGIVKHEVKTAVEAALHAVPTDADLQVGGSNGWSPAGGRADYQIVGGERDPLLLQVWQDADGDAKPPRLPWHWSAYRLNREYLSPEFVSTAPTAGLAMKCALKAVGVLLPS